MEYRPPWPNRLCSISLPLRGSSSAPYAPAPYLPWACVLEVETFLCGDVPPVRQVLKDLQRRQQLAEEEASHGVESGARPPPVDVRVGSLKESVTSGA